MENKINLREKYTTELDAFFRALEFENYREVERIIDKVNDSAFTRYCVTLLVDELISFETASNSQEEEEED